MKAADWIALASGIGGGALAAYGASKNRTQDRELREDENELSEAQGTQRTALTESLANPFRHQVDQTRALTSLDMLQQFGQGGRHVTPPSNVAPYSGNVRPGYAPSDRMRTAAGTLFDNIAGGNTAPTMTDPTNYGKTAALDLVRIASDRADPASVNASGAPPRSVGAYTEGVQTRTAGGLGASETRSTDVTVQQAQQILDRAFRSELGRAPQPGEINQLLASQGLKPGDRWVGSGGLNGILNSLRSQAQAAPMQPSYTGH